MSQKNIKIFFVPSTQSKYSQQLSQKLRLIHQKNPQFQLTHLPYNVKNIVNHTQHQLRYQTIRVGNMECRSNQID